MFQHTSELNSVKLFQVDIRPCKQTPVSGCICELTVSRQASSVLHGSMKQAGALGAKQRYSHAPGWAQPPLPHRLLLLLRGLLVWLLLLRGRGGGH